MNADTRFKATVTLDIEDFYSVVNVLRDACGCPDCLEIANKMLRQRNEQTKPSNPIDRVQDCTDPDCTVCEV